MSRKNSSANLKNGFRNFKDLSKGSEINNGMERKYDNKQ